MARRISVTVGLMSVVAIGSVHTVDGRSDHMATERAAVAVSVFQFHPETVTVGTGSRVVWTNHDDIEHTITSGTPLVPDERLADGTLRTKGATHDVTLGTPGTYPYFCERHTFMRGAVRVTP